MRWEDLPSSDNVEDRRGESGPTGGGFGFPGGGGGLSIGAIVVLGLVGWALGIDPSLLIGGAEMLTREQPRMEAPTQTGPRRTGTPQDQMGRFVANVLGSTEVQWKAIFAKDGKTYRAPTLVIYRGSTDAKCGQGLASASMGPFYCPADRKIYLDTSFFNQIESRFRGCDSGSKSCQFAQAYVIAHEVGHHVQNLLGILPQVQQRQQGGSRAAANRLQVRVELQADCFAGIWAHHSEEQWKLLQPGDIEAALRTAAAIGDDTLQKRAQGYAVPDSFTHGTSDQRQRWFSAGLKSGAIASCNTFAAQSI